MDFEISNIVFAFILTLLAGLSTGIGGLLALVTKKTSKKFLSVSLGFSAGVMIFVSFVEIFDEAKITLISQHGERGGAWATVGSFFLGILIIGIIDWLIPEDHNPHEAHMVEEMDGNSEHHKNSLMRTGVFTALAIAIHNFPEGFATFVAALNDPQLGISIAVAIAIHNVPEGVSVAVPIFYATGDRKKAFLYSFLSGLAEPLGAIVGFLVLRPFLSETLMGVVLAAIAGIMVYISLDELLPAAKEYGKHHHAILGLVAGMAVMALSLLLFL